MSAFAQFSTNAADNVSKDKGQLSAMAIHNDFLEGTSPKIEPKLTLNQQNILNTNLTKNESLR